MWKNNTRHSGGHLATPRWSRTLILVIVACSAVIRDCRNVRLLLLSRLELPQLTKASGERPQKLILKRGTGQREWGQAKNPVRLYAP
jgi:hypothetical protein